MVGGGVSGDVFHVRLKLRQYVRWGGGCGVGRYTVDGAGSNNTAKRGATLLVRLVVAICCGVSGEEGFFPCHPSVLCLLELVPSLAFGWEGKGGAERVCGNGGRVPAFNGAVGSCSLFLSLFCPKYVLRHARSLVPPRWHGEADINGVCVIKNVTVVI